MCEISTLKPPLNNLQLRDGIALKRSTAQNLPWSLEFAIMKIFLAEQRPSIFVSFVNL